MLRFLCLTSCLFIATQAFAQNKRFRLPDELNEVSGLIALSQDSLIWLNDSGNAPLLYLTNGTGCITKVFEPQGLRNKDWEDLAIDDQKNIYIGDFGNNGNRRKDLKIYIYNPDTQLLDSILYQYPDQEEFPPEKRERNFDMEAFFWYKGNLHLFSKNSQENKKAPLTHYRIKAKRGEQEAEIIERKVLKNRVATAAAINEKGDEVMLLSYRYDLFLGFFPVTKTGVFVFTDFEQDNFLSGKIHKQKIRNFIFPTQFESIDYLGNGEFIIASERTAFIGARGRRLKLKNRKK